MSGKLVYKAGPANECQYDITHESEFVLEVNGTAVEVIYLKTMIPLA